MTGADARRLDADAPPGDGPARAVLRRHLRLAPTGCRSGLGMPGVRDRHSGCVSTYLVEHDLFDFLLLSLPGQRLVLAQERARRPARSRSPRPTCSWPASPRPRAGSSEFLAEHAMIVMADHSQAPVTRRSPCRTSWPSWASSARRARSRLARRRRRAADRRLPLPAGGDGLRAARVRARRDARLGGRRSHWRSTASTCRSGSSATPTSGPREGVIASPRHGELRFAPAADRRDPRGRRLERRGRARRARRRGSRTGAC